MEEIKEEIKNEEKAGFQTVKAFDDGNKNLGKKVTRKEVIEVVQQIIDNVNQVSNYLMQDVNTMYAKQVFPFQIQMSVVLDVLEEKGILTKEELTNRYNEKIKILQEKAREIKEDEDGARLATKEEDEISEKKKIIQVVSNSTKKE